MNIALPAIVIILGLLPGILFFHGYFSGRFPKQVAAISGVSELALYVVFAVPVDAIALACTSGLGIEVDYRLLGRLLLGENSKDAGTTLGATIGATRTITAVSYSLVLLGSFLLGNILRKLVWTFRLDLRVAFLRMKHEWFYILQGRLPPLSRSIVPYADVLVEHPDGTQLYQGIVSSFEVNRDGGINQLILREAYRGKGRGQEFSWKPIPGDRFIVMGAAIRSLNMRYIAIEQPAAAAKSDRYKRWARRLLRTFFFEEP